MPKLPEPDFNVYATLIDSFQNYLNSALIWEQYWGWSENPPHTPEEFEEQQYQGLIDRINRVPFDSEAADKGTAFNELVDCLIEHRGPSEKFNFEKVYKVETYRTKDWYGNDNMDFIPGHTEQRQTDELVAIKVFYNDREFIFDIELCREFASYYKGAVTQYYTEAILPTKYGNVKLYGFLDELMPDCIHDIKTTGRYSVGKFKDHAQHLVYPYCLTHNGMDVRMFEYNIAVLDKYGRWETFTETYAFKAERDIPVLTQRVEALIEFLNDNRDKITDKKIAPIWERYNG